MLLMSGRCLVFKAFYFNPSLLTIWTMSVFLAFLNPTCGKPSFSSLMNLIKMTAFVLSRSEVGVFQVLIDWTNIRELIRHGLRGDASVLEVFQELDWEPQWYNIWPASCSHFTLKVLWNIFSDSPHLGPVTCYQNLGKIVLQCGLWANMTLQTPSWVFSVYTRPEGCVVCFFQSIFEGTSKKDQCLDVQKSLTYSGNKVKKK